MFHHRLRVSILGGMAGLLALGLGVSDCSLGDIAADSCASNAECAEAFGFGSTCVDGYCAESGCITNEDCHLGVGVGTACAAGSCVAAPLDAACTIYPDDAPRDLQTLASERLLLGALFRTETPRDEARLAAVQLAVDELNENVNGLDGKPIALLVCNFDADDDSTTDADEAATLTRYLAGDVGLPVVIGPGSSSAALASVGVLTDNGFDTAIVSPSATGVALTSLNDRLRDDDPHGLFWRTCPSDALQGTVLAQQVEMGGLTQPTVIFQNDTYGTGLRDTFREEFETGGGSINTVPFEREDAGSQAMAISTAVSNAPDAVVIVSGDADSALALITLAAQEPTLSTLPFFLTDGAKDQAVLLTSGDSAVDAILQNTVGTAPANPTGGNLLDDLAARGIDASQFSFVAHAYDAAYVAIYGIAGAPAQRPRGRDIAAGMALLSGGPAIDVGPTQFPEAVQTLRGPVPGIDLEGESGRLNFDPETGEAPAPIEVWSVTAGGDAFERVGMPITP